MDNRRKKKQSQDILRRFFTDGDEASSRIFFWGALILSILLLNLPSVMRWAHQQPSVMGTDTAKTLALVHGADTSSFIVQDPFVHESRGMAPWLRLLCLSNLPDDALQIIPMALGILTFLVWWSILSRFFSKKSTFIITLLMLINPVYLSVFSELSSWPFIALLVSLSVAAALSRKDAWAGFLMSIIIIEDPWCGIFTAALLCLLLSFEKKQKDRKPRLLRLGALGIAVFMAAMLLNPLPPYALQTPFSALSDLGVDYGMASAIILLMLIGAAVAWRSRPDPSLLAAYAVLAFSFLWLPGRVVLMPLAGILAMQGITFLGTRTWSYASMKQFTLLLMVCTLFISMSTFYAVRASQLPTKEMAQALTSLQQLQRTSGPGNAAVLSRPGMGEFLEYYSASPVVVDTTMLSQGSHAWEDAQRALLSRNPEETFSLFRKTGVTMFLIDPDLQTELEEKGSGILFLINVTDLFEQVNSDPHYRLYALKMPAK